MGTKILDANIEKTSLNGNEGVAIQTPGVNNSEFTLFNYIKDFIFNNLIIGGNANKFIKINSGGNNIEAVNSDELTKYSSAFPDNQLVSALGGVEATQSAGSLRNKTFTEILDLLLFKAIPAVYNLPTVSLARVGGFNFYKFGTNVTLNFTSTFNQSNASGGLTSHTFKKNNVIIQTLPISPFNQPTTDNLTVDENIVSYKSTCGYAGGVQLQDNLGNNSGTPLSPGSVDSNTITVQGLLPVLTKISTSEITNPVTLDGTFNELYKGNVNNANNSTGQFINGDSFTLVLNAGTKSVVVAIDNGILGTLGNLEQVDANGVVEGNPTIPTVYTATYLGRNYNVYNYTFAAVPSGIIRFKYTL